MATLAKFLNEYPEFRATDESLITAKLAAATRRVAADVWGDRADDGVLLYTAHLLSVAAAGEHARKDTMADSAYLQEFRRLLREVTFGLRVT